MSVRSGSSRRQPEHQPRDLHTLAACEWVAKGQPLSLIGDSGTGKSHLLIGLGAEAAMNGHRVRYVLAAKLVNELVEAADERQLTKTIARYGRVDLLGIDELGYMELDKRGAELLFQVLTEREKNNSVAIASNESFGGWTKTFTDPRLCAAIVDRLTFGGNSSKPAPIPNGSRKPAPSSTPPHPADRPPARPPGPAAACATRNLHSVAPTPMPASQRDRTAPAVSTAGCRQGTSRGMLGTWTSQRASQRR
jgi:hypothetical protein